MRLWWCSHPESRQGLFPTPTCIHVPIAVAKSLDLPQVARNVVDRWHPTVPLGTPKKANRTVGTVYRKTYTKPLPATAEILTRKGERLARWKDSKGKTRPAPRHRIDP